MPEYLFADGPLTGQTLGTSDHLLVGEALAVEVVDVGQELGVVPTFDYVVDSEPDEDQPGLLRHSTPPALPGTDRGRPCTAA